jgi:hypothetical protein
MPDSIAQIVINGAGIMGASIGYHHRQRRAVDYALRDRATISWAEYRVTIVSLI